MSAEQWRREFHNISVKYGDKLVQIRTDKASMDYLALPGNGSLELADHIKCTYQSIYGKELQISRDSLAIEILIHAYLDVFMTHFEKIQKISPSATVNKIVSYMKKIEFHTEIIDSGEADIDTNRHIFDSLV